MSDGTYACCQRDPRQSHLTSAVAATSAYFCTPGAKLSGGVEQAGRAIADAGTCRPRTPGSEKTKRNEDRCAGGEAVSGEGTFSSSRRAKVPPRRPLLQARHAP